MASRKIPRKRLELWLRLDKRDEVELLYDIIPALKKKQQFSSAIRDGLRLVWELRQGKTDYLFQLFPFVKEAVQPDPAELVTLITNMMHTSAATNFPLPRPLPTCEAVPVVSQVDESKAQEITVQNTLAALADF